MLLNINFGYCIAILQCYCKSISKCYCTTILKFCCSAILNCYCPPIVKCYCTAILKCYCTTILKFCCSAILNCHCPAIMKCYRTGSTAILKCSCTTILKFRCWAIFNCYCPAILKNCRAHYRTFFQNNGIIFFNRLLSSLLKCHCACKILKTVYFTANSKQCYANSWKLASQISLKVTAQNVIFHCTTWLLNYTFCAQLHVRITPVGQRELIWLEKDMSESKMKPRLRAEELTGMIALLRDKFVR